MWPLSSLESLNVIAGHFNPEERLGTAWLRESAAGVKHSLTYKSFIDLSELLLGEKWSDFALKTLIWKVKFIASVLEIKTKRFSVPLSKML